MQRTVFSLQTGMNSEQMSIDEQFQPAAGVCCVSKAGHSVPQEAAAGMVGTHTEHPTSLLYVSHQCAGPSCRSRAKKRAKTDICLAFQLLLKSSLPAFCLVYHRGAMTQSTVPWDVFPPTPRLDLSQAQNQGLLQTARGIRLWHAMFGIPLEKTLATGRVPILLMHGGVSSSDWNALQVRYLAPHYTVMVLDLPGHGRSPFDDRELSYKKLARDIAGILDILKIPKVAIISWSEGTMIAWSMLAYGQHDRVERAFCYSALDDYRKADAEKVMQIWMVGEYFDRTQREWEASHPGEKWDKFLSSWMTMWTREPIWTAETFDHVPVRGESKDAPIVWIVTGDQDEWIPRETHDRMAKFIRNSSYLKMPSAGHLTFLQNPKMYHRMIDCFLEDCDIPATLKASL